MSSPITSSPATKARYFLLGRESFKCGIVRKSQLTNVIWSFKSSCSPSVDILVYYFSAYKSPSVVKVKRSE